MAFIDDAKQLITNGDIIDEGFDFLSDTINALLGDPVSAGRIIIALARSPFLFREKLFWGKIEQYLNGVYVEEEDRAKLCAKLVENGTSSENAKRLVACIDRAETSRKIQYLINATRCLLADFIDRETFFRICRAITDSLDEDLQYLRDHLGENNLSYNDNVQGLYSSGLMCLSMIGGEENKYSFTPIAFTVDEYAVSYHDVERYPNPCADAQHQLPNATIPTATDEETKEMLDDVFGRPSAIHTQVAMPIGEF